METPLDSLRYAGGRGELRLGVAMEADSRREEADKYALEVLAKLNGRLEEIQGQLGEFQRVVAGGMEVLRVHQKRSTITQ